jgi:restriction system protein
MAIPDYQTLMLPVLRVGAAGETSVRECIEQLAKQFRLTDEERAQLLPSGKQTTFVNRVHWAITYMVKAGLLNRTKRAHFAVTDRGKAVLARGPQRIDSKLLDEFEEFGQFYSGRDPHEAGRARPGSNLGRSHSWLEAASGEIDEGLRTELLERVVQGTPTFFEKLVIDLLPAMNYGAGVDSGKRLGGTGDGGIDRIINEDALGLDTVYIQAKKYAPGNCQRSPKESHPGSPIWSQCGDVTGPRSYRLPLFLLGSVAAAGAAGGDLLLSVFGPEALTGNLDEVRPVGQSIEGGRGQQGLAEQVGPFRPVPIRGQED